MIARKKLGRTKAGSEDAKKAAIATGVPARVLTNCWALGKSLPLLET